MCKFMVEEGKLICKSRFEIVQVSLEIIKGKGQKVGVFLKEMEQNVVKIMDKVKMNWIGVD